MLIGNRFIDELQSERVAYIGGSLDAGKTRLAFEAARFLWLRGYRVIANVPHNYLRPESHDKSFLYKSVVILDEGGEFFRDAKTGSVITRSAAKSDYYVLIPAKRPPHKSMVRLSISPRFNFLSVYGIPAIWWKVVVRADQNYTVSFWQIFPGLIHGTYSTKTSAGGIEIILSLAEKTAKKLANDEGQEAGQELKTGLAQLQREALENFSV